MSAPKKSNKAAEEARRELQVQEFETAIEKLSTLASTLKSQRQNLDLLKSVSAGLYEEIDKLAKKSPADEISTMALEHVNDLIRESKELSPQDLYMQRCKVFVAAGNNPQHRDVVLVLRQVRQGLDRFSEGLTERTAKNTVLLEDAKGLRMALLIINAGQEVASISHLRSNDVTVSKEWLQNSEVNFNRLNRIDISTYFAEPE